MDYKLPRTARTCSRCAHTFDPSERYTSAIQAQDVSEVAMTFQRLEFCTACWDALATEPEGRSALFSWWASERAALPTKPPTSDPPFLWALLAHGLEAQGAAATAPVAPAGEPAGEPAGQSTATPKPQPPAGVAGESASASGVASEEWPALTYLAALGLMRLKQLRLDRTVRRDGAPHLVFSSRATRKQILVRDPGLPDEALPVLEGQLLALRTRLIETGSLSVTVAPQ